MRYNRAIKTTGVDNMRFERFTNVNQFYNATFNTLMGHEAQNSVLLGNIIMGNKGEDISDWRDPQQWFMATVSDI